MKLVKLQNLVQNVVKLGKYNLAKFANFVYVCITVRAEIVTIFSSKIVTISARNTNIYKICKLRKAIFSVFTTFHNQILQFY
jgi:hypothetical protein